MDAPRKDLFAELLELTAASLDDENDKNKQRDRFISDIFIHGGKEFVKRVEQYGYTEKGDKVALAGWFREYLELIGDYRIPHTITQGCSQTGKASSLDSKVLTPTGWKRMGDIQLGDWVMSIDGTKCQVLGVYPQGIKDIYEVVMDDSSTAECTEDHLWLTQTCQDRNAGNKSHNRGLQGRGIRQRDWELTEYLDRPGKVKTLAEIKDSLWVKKADGTLRLTRGVTKRANHSLPCPLPFEFEETESLPLHPYLLGVLIGDGCFSSPDGVSFSSADVEIVNRVVECLEPGLELRSRGKNNHYDYRICGDGKTNSVIRAIAKLNLTGHKSATKFIPDIYKFANIENRLELLRGLMDTDGTAEKRGGISFTSVSLQLIEDVRELVWSLGGICGKIASRLPQYTHNGQRLVGQRAYTLRFRFRNDIKPFHLTRKNARCVDRNIKNHRRYIYDVRLIGQKECQCIHIDHPSHLYITDNYIPTHNTLGHNLLLADTIVHGKVNCGWMFSSRDSREVNVPEQQKPLLEKYAEEYEKLNNVKLKERSDRKLSSRFQIGGITAIFSYLSTSKASESKSGLAAAGASAVSFSAHVCFVEEAGQSTPEAAEVVMPRLAASRIPTRPRRDLGTPGSGASSVDVIMTQTDRNFYPTVQCKSCRKYTPLHPFGCLLKPIQRKNQVGKMVTTYLSESGRPLEWHCHDPENPVNTAFIGCPNCGAELDLETRQGARYRCTRTQEWLRDYLDSLPVNDPEACANMRSKIGIHISPLVRKTKHNLAADIIDKGLKSARTADFIQQVLGLTSDNFVTGVTLEMLKKALAAPKPDGTPDFTLCGLDMGRAHDFLTITEFYLPEDYRYLDQVELSKRTIRRVVFSSEVIREKAKDIISRHKVAYGICDNEPGRDSVMTFCNEVGQLADIKLEMADQKDTLKDAVKLDKVKDGGAEYPCWFVRNQKFQDLILENFLELAEDGYCLYRLPEVWNKHLSSKSDLSPFKHLTSPTRDPESDRWVRAADGNDDLFYSFLFMEVAFYIYCEKMLKYPVWIGGV